MKKIDHSEDVGIDLKIILHQILGTQGGKVWTGCIWLKIGTSGSCKHSNEPSCSINGREFD
jgi:hypothetical protein